MGWTPGSKESLLPPPSSSTCVCFSPDCSWALRRWSSGRWLCFCVLQGGPQPCGVAKPAALAPKEGDLCDVPDPLERPRRVSPAAEIAPCPPASPASSPSSPPPNSALTNGFHGAPRLGVPVCNSPTLSFLGGHTGVTITSTLLAGSEDFTEITCVCEPFSVEPTSSHRLQ